MIATHEYEQLLAAAVPYYEFSNRQYHNLYHVASAIHSVPDIEKDHEMIIMALGWHDAIYIPGSKVNEAASADAFEYEWKKLGIQGNELFRINVAWLIRYTTIDNHLMNRQLESDSHEAIVMDCDLASLAMPYEAFLKNQHNIILENNGSPDNPDHLRMSSSFLHKLANSRDYIYHNKQMRQRFEQKAQDNIARYHNEHS